MKTMLLFMISLSTIIYSQKIINVDTIVSQMGNSHQCFITYLDDDYVMIKSQDGSDLKFFLETIDSIRIENLGNVYSESSGFTLSLDSLEVFLIARNRKHPPNISQKVSTVHKHKKTQQFNGDKKWFFAIHYYPSITKQLLFTYSYWRSSISAIDRYYQPIYFELEQNLVAMESQLGLNVHENLFITLSLGYSSDLYKSTSRENNIISGGVTRIVTENQNSMDKFLFEIGLKYYFGYFEISSVNPFITFSIGKQLAFADDYNESYILGSVDENAYTDNSNEFMEGLNSPIFASVGFGAEYAISKSLSLSGFLKIKYNSASSTFEWSVGAGNYGKEDVENTSVRYKTGLGLNFFF